MYSLIQLFNVQFDSVNNILIQLLITVWFSLFIVQFDSVVNNSLIQVVNNSLIQLLITV